MDGDWARIAATFLLGQAAVIGIEWFRSWLDRDQRRRDARDDFQKQTLIELQEALYNIVRSMSNIIIEYELLSEGKRPPVWQPAEDPRLLSAGTLARIDALTERVRDEQTRELVDRFIRKHEEMFSEPRDSGLEIVKSHRDALRDAQVQVNKRIGELLRDLY